MNSPTAAAVAAVLPIAPASRFAPCECSGPGWCSRHGRYVLGKAWDVCAGHMGSPATRDVLLAGWASAAPGSPPAVDRSRPCDHLGQAVLDQAGVPVLRDCETCAGHVRQKLFACHHPAHHADPTTTVLGCERCPDFLARHGRARRVRLCNDQSPGDAAVITMAIESLHLTHPGRFRTAVRTASDPIFAYNPKVVTFAPGESVEEFFLDYPLIHQSNNRPIHFGEALAHRLGELLGVALDLRVNRPVLYLSPSERAWRGTVTEIAADRVPFWLLNAGYKDDFTTKAVTPETWQSVVDLLRDKVRFVQVGQLDPRHHHPRLDGVVDLVGRTSLRDLVALAWHAAGGCGPSTLLQHLCAGWGRPYVVVDAAREPASWICYPTQTSLVGHGTLPCCRAAACWKTRVLPLGDGGNDQALCERPNLQREVPVAECVARITPGRIADAILNYETGGTR